MDIPVFCPSFCGFYNLPSLRRVAVLVHHCFWSWYTLEQVAKDEAMSKIISKPAVLVVNVMYYVLYLYIPRALDAALMTLQ